MKEIINYGITYGFKDFISDEEKSNILKWIDENRTKFKFNGNKCSLTLEGMNLFPTEILDELRDRIVKIDEISSYKIPLKSKVFISEYYTGSQCLEHMDSCTEIGYNHVRYNILLSKPNLGGETIIDGKYLDIDEKVLWKCESDKHRHGSDLIYGSKPRTIISFGFDIPMSP